MAVRISCHCEFILRHFNVAGELESQVSFSMGDHYSSVILSEVKKPFLNVDFLLGLHVKHEVSSGRLPIGAEVEVEENFGLLVINQLDVSDLVLFELSNKPLEVSEIQVPIGMDIFLIELHLLDKQCLNLLAFLGGVGYVTVAEDYSNLAADEVVSPAQTHLRTHAGCPGLESLVESLDLEQAIRQCKHASPTVDR